MHRYAHCNNYITEKLEAISTPNIKKQLTKLYYKQKDDRACNHLRYSFKIPLTILHDTGKCWVILNFKKRQFYTLNDSKFAKYVYAQWKKNGRKFMLFSGSEF